MDIQTYSKHLFKVIVFATVAGCGGSKESPELPSLTVVAVDASPVSQTTGVKLQAQGGGEIFGLSPTATGPIVKTIEVQKLNVQADLSKLVGEGFARFGGFSTGDVAAIRNVTVTRVAECDIASKRCAAIPVAFKDGLAIFDIVDGKYYAIQKQ